LRIVCFKGRVSSGRGEGARFMRLPWVKKQIEEELGFVPFSGTLNVKITEKSVKFKGALAEGGGVDIKPATGFCKGKCYKASFKTELECAIIFPEVAGYPEDLIEIIGPENLRKKFHLSDGDLVEVKVVF
jgi:riboflavin kinase